MEVVQLLGSNVPTVGGLPTGFKYADEWGCECVQIYVTLSRRWAVPELTEKEVQSFKSSWEASQVKRIVAHVPFLVNIASPNGDLRRQSIARLITESDRANKLGVSYLVLHPGSNPDREKGLALIVDGLDAVLNSIDRPGVKILLENAAGQGNSICSRFEEIALILERAQKPNLLGVCIDTCHLFAAGYDIRGYGGYEKVLKEFDALVGLHRIKAIHVNDSKTGLGSRVDRHASIGDGFLGLQVFHAVVRDDRFDRTPKILEIPERDTRSKANMEMLRRLRDRNKPLVGSDRNGHQIQLPFALGESENAF